jgi:hypothetical protein
MCKQHGAAIDTKDPRFTVELLRTWKAQAEQESWREVLYFNQTPHPRRPAPIESELNTQLRAAAATDVAVFRRSNRWPPTAVALTLEVDGLSDPVSTSSLAMALQELDDLILVAPPGMGKTTTVFQIADSLLHTNSGSPIIVSLGDWATDRAPLLKSILRRPAFRGIAETDLRAVAAQPGVFLLLDGWNELGTAARRSLAVQVEQLQGELPELGFVISTRKQSLDVPVSGKRINLRPLSAAQQRDIAKSLRGEVGLRMVDRAWRTEGVRELVAIPLYLRALLTLPSDAAYPTTKEEMLQHFAGAHRRDTKRADVLDEATNGLHKRFLEDLAATATHAAATSMADEIARRSIS